MKLIDLTEYQNRLKKLEAYEATGLEPEEVAAMVSHPLACGCSWEAAPMLADLYERNYA
ncbi:MAG: hypothetical protein GX650_01085 [Clostridiales bacterium]|nr:hypothetical protein [Clostridiales bacterium]